MIKLRLPALTLALAASPLFAANLAITNADFETDGFLTDNFSNSPGVIPTGWSAIGDIDGGFFGYFNPNDGAYVGTTGGSSVIAGMTGANVFYFGSASDGQGIQQTLADTFAADTDYALTVALGARIGNLANTASLTMNLLAGSTVIATQTVRNTANDGTFADFTLNYSFISGDSGLIGENLAIQFIEDDTIAVGEVDIDSVRLTAVVAIPEPASTTALLGLATLGIGLASRRRA